MFNTNIINESPHGDEHEFYNNDDDYDTVMNVIKLVLDSAATDDVMSKNDNDAVKEDVDDEIKVDTAGGLVTIRELMSKVHEDGLETVKGSCSRPSHPQP